MRRLLFALPLVALTLASCSDGGTKGATGTGKGTTTTRPADGGTLPPVSIASTTTFIKDCATMPSTADIAKAVGVPLSDGQVTGAGTCQYLGLNDQSKVVVLSLLTDPVDQKYFKDLQKSLGASKAIAVKGVKGAKVGPDSTVYATVNGAVYAVHTAVTGAALPKQVPLSVKVLQRWVQL